MFNQKALGDFQRRWLQRWLLEAAHWQGFCWALKVYLCFSAIAGMTGGGHLPFSWGGCEWELMAAPAAACQQDGTGTSHSVPAPVGGECQPTSDSVQTPSTIPETSGRLHSQSLVAVPWISALESCSPRVTGSTALDSLSQLLLLFSFPVVTSFHCEWCLVYAECIPDGAAHLSSWSLCQ